MSVTLFVESREKEEGENEDTWTIRKSRFNSIEEWWNIEDETTHSWSFEGSRFKIENKGSWWCAYFVRSNKGC